MKFIVDAQLPQSLSNFLRDKGYDSIHTIELVKANRTFDSEIIGISERENRIIITKDSDFLDSFLLFGRPEKLLLLKTGNIKNSELLHLFENYIEKICTLLETNSLIQVNREEIIVHR